MKINQLKWGSILSYLQMFVSVLIGLIYTPAMIRFLGQSEYGLYTTISSTMYMLSILAPGFTSGYIRYYCKYKKENDQEGIYRLNGLFLIIFIILGLIGFVCGLFLTFHLELIFDMGLSAGEYNKAKVMMFLLTIDLIEYFPMSILTNIISAHEKYIFLKIIGIGKTVVAPLLSFLLLLMGFRSIAMVTVTVLISFITDSIYLVYVVKVLKNRFIFRGLEKGIFWNIFFYTSFIAINIFVDQINWNIDKVLLGRFRGTAEVAVYSVGYSLYRYYMMFSISISSVFTPRIHEIASITDGNCAEQRKQFTELFTKVGRIQFMILGLIASGIIFFGKNFLKLWVGDGYNGSYYVALLLILPASIDLIQNLGIEIQRAENKHQFRSIVYLGMALINFGLSVYLCQVYGAVGSTIGTACSLITANGVIMNFYYHRYCNIDILFFWNNIFRQARGLLVPAAFGMILVHVLHVNSWISFLFGIFCYSCIYCISMWCLGMNQYEKNLVIDPVRKIRKKISALI